MSLEIRPVRVEELADFVFANAYAFHQDRRKQALEEMLARVRATLPLESSLAAFVDGRLVAGMRLIPFVMRIDGARLGMGGVGGVACLPEHRRRGYVGKLLKHALSDMRDRGQVVSALYTPHVALYRRYGWETAAKYIRFSFAPRDVRTLVRPPVEGRFRRVAVDDWETLNGVYEEYSTRRNGVVQRTEAWWQQSLFGGEPYMLDAALWEDGDGRPRGYVLYYTRRTDLPDRPWPQSRLWVRELVTQDPEAYVALVNYLLAHDLHERIEWSAPADEPLLSLLDDPRRVDAEVWTPLMLRVVNVAAALRARGCAPQAGGRRFTMAIRDAVAPWNEGTWRVEAEAGRLEVSAVQNDADFTLDVTVLAELFNGYLSPHQAARAGLLEVSNAIALDDAAAVFAVEHPPFCPDWF